MWEGLVDFGGKIEGASGSVLACEGAGGGARGESCNPSAIDPGTPEQCKPVLWHCYVVEGALGDNIVRVDQARPTPVEGTQRVRRDCVDV